jgi:hypothetical protein
MKRGTAVSQLDHLSANQGTIKRGMAKGVILSIHATNVLLAHIEIMKTNRVPPAVPVKQDLCRMKTSQTVWSLVKNPPARRLYLRPPPRPRLVTSVPLLPPLTWQRNLCSLLSSLPPGWSENHNTYHTRRPTVRDESSFLHRNLSLFILARHHMITVITIRYFLIFSHIWLHRIQYFLTKLPLMSVRRITDFPICLLHTTFHLVHRLQHVFVFPAIKYIPTLVS